MITWPTEYSAWWVLIVFIVWLYMLWRCKPWVTYKNPQANAQRTNTTWFFLLLILVSVCGLHRWDTYHMVDVEGLYNHLEPVYKWLVDNVVGANYLLFRILVFGTATVLFWVVASMLKCNNRNFLLACTLVIVDSMFNEMRGTLGHCILLLGITLIGIDSKRKRYVVLGLGLIAVSFFFHRSLFLGIATAVIALVIPWNKTTVIGSWLLFPVITILINGLLSDFINGLFVLDFGEEMGTQASAIGYAEAESLQLNRNGIIGRVITSVPQVLLFFYLSIKVGFNKTKLTRLGVFFFSWYYICTYLGAALSFADSSAWIYKRIMVMGIYPLPFVLADVWSGEAKPNVWVKAIVVCNTLVCIYGFVYRMYIFNW